MFADFDSFAVLGPRLVWIVIVGGFALLSAVLGAGLLVQRRGVSAAAATAPLALASVVMAVGACWSVSGMADLAPADRVDRVVAFGASWLVGALSMGPALVVLWLGTAFLGAREAPRAWPLAAVGGAVGMAVVGVVMWGGADANWIFASVRSVAYALAAVLIAVSALGSWSDDPARNTASVVGASLLPIAVAWGEASERGLVQLLLTQQTTTVVPEKWPAAVGWMLQQVATEAVAGTLALGLASAWALGIAGTQTRRHGAAPLIAGCLGIVAAVVVWSFADLGAARLDLLSEACTGTP